MYICVCTFVTSGLIKTLLWDLNTYVGTIIYTYTYIKILFCVYQYIYIYIRIFLYVYVCECILLRYSCIVLLYHMMALTQKGWLALKDKTVQVQVNTHHTNAYTNTHTYVHTHERPSWYIVCLFCCTSHQIHED